jgi:hypothetical protein
MNLRKMKVLSKFVIVGIILFLFISCTNKNDISNVEKGIIINKTNENKVIMSDNAPLCYTMDEINLLDSKNEYSFLKQISNLKEVKKVYDENQHKILFCTTLTKKTDYYQSNSYHVKVDLETEDHYSTQFNFYVDKENHNIKILDVVSDSLFKIEEWRNKL